MLRPTSKSYKHGPGWTIHYLGPAAPIRRMTKIVYGKEWDADKYDDKTGVSLRIVKMYPQANEVFTPEELEERLDKIRERVLAEEARINSSRERSSETKYSGYQKPKLPGTADSNGPRAWIDLKVCYCTGCKRMLLGESEEKQTRETMIAMGRDKAAKMLPPPVALRTDDGQPYCKRCVKE